MSVFIAPSDLWAGANDNDVDRVVRELTGRGFQVHPAPGREHGPSRPREQRFGEVVAMTRAYFEIVGESETVVSDIINAGP